jgi:Zn-dependent protease with chaperone function
MTPMSDPAAQAAPGPPGSDAASYHRTRRLIAVSGYVVDAGLLLALLFAGWSASIRSLAETLRPEPPLALLIYALVLGLLFKAASLAFDYLGGFWLEHRYGLSKLTWMGWLKDEAKESLVGALLGLGVLECFYAVARAWPEHWWVILGVIFAGFFILMANLAPVVIVPIFFKMTPLANPGLEERLRRLMDRAGASVKGVYEWKLGEKTKKANAALVGLGNTRRILLADTLLKDFSEDEIEAVLAHELGHHAHGDIWSLLAVQTSATFLGLYGVSLALTRWSSAFGFRSPSDFANLPLVALVTLAISLLLLPLVNSFSRWLERRADLYALQAVADPSVFASSLERLAALNLAERQPHPWIEFIFHSHPSIKSRIRFVHEVAALRATKAASAAS